MKKRRKEKIYHGSGSRFCVPAAPSKLLFSDVLPVSLLCEQVSSCLLAVNCSLMFHLCEQVHSQVNFCSVMFYLCHYYVNR